MRGSNLKNRPIRFDAGFYMRVGSVDLKRMRELAKNAGKQLTEYIRDCALTAADRRIVTAIERSDSSPLIPVSAVSPSPENETENTSLECEEKKRLSLNSRASLDVSARTGHKNRCRCIACHKMRQLLTGGK